MDYPHWKDDGCEVEGYWNHPHHGKWVLYRERDPETGEVLGNYEYQENRNQPRKESDHYREIEDVEEFFDQVNLLERNRSVYNRTG